MMAKCDSVWFAGYGVAVLFGFKRNIGFAITLQ